MFWKKPELTKREREIRNYILEEHAAEIYVSERLNSMYGAGRADEAAEILGKILDILGG